MLNADQIFHREYQGSTNFMTPEILRRGIADSNEQFKLAYELSKGRGISNQVIFGVTVVKYDRQTHTTQRLTHKGGLCYSEKEANDFINKLRIDS